MAGAVFGDNTNITRTWTRGVRIASVTVPAVVEGTRPVRYYVQASRPLPAGISFNPSTRVISGTPTEAGSGRIGIRATDANNQGTDTWRLEYTIVAPPPPRRRPSFSDDTGDAQAWTERAAITPITVPAASGLPTPTYAAVGSLPAGIVFNTGTRVISGTPSTGGSGTITIRATNSQGSDDWTVDYATAFVNRPPTITAIAANPTTVDERGVVTLTATVVDPDVDTLTYLWTSDGGGVFANAAQKDTTWTAPDVVRETAVTLTLLVTDSGGLTATDSVAVTVRDSTPSVAHAVDAGDVSWRFVAVVHRVFVSGFTRLSSLDALDAIFRRHDTGNINGAWQQDSGGTTPSTETGPGTNSAGSYVHSESTGTANPDIPLTSTLTALPTVMSSWVGEGRVLALRACIQGNGTYPNDTGAGLQIQGRVANSDAWTTIELLEGWAYSNSLNPGDTVMDSRGVTKVVAQAGGWVDFEVTIPDAHRQLRIRNIPAFAGESYRHDAALWHISLRDGTPPAHTLNAGDVAWTFALPQATVAHTLPAAHTVNAAPVAWTFDLPRSGITHAARPLTNHAVNPGDAAWTFVAPQPAVTHTAHIPAAHTVNASPAAWTFALPEASVTRTAATVPAQPTGLVATVTHDTISLSWDDPGDASITSYQILRRDISGGGSLGVHIDSVPAGTSYVDTTNVASENAYSYRIKARNAQGLSGQSAFRNVTTSAPPVVTTDHTVNAGDAEWTFAAPQASVTHTGPADHAVDAGDASWAFAVPRAGVAHTAHIPAAHTVNAAAVSWTFALPRSSVTHGPAAPAPTQPSYTAGAVTEGLRGAGGTTLVAIPSHSAGDRLIVMIGHTYSGSPVASIPPPTGWTVLLEGEAGGVSAVGLAAWSKVGNGSESTVTIPATPGVGRNGFIAIAVAVSGVIGIETVSLVKQESGTDINSPSITPTGAATILRAFVFDDDAPTLSDYATDSNFKGVALGYDEAVRPGNGFAAGFSIQVNTAANVATGTSTWSSNGDSDAGLALTIALLHGAATTPTTTAHVVDAGDVEWTFVLARSSVTHALPIDHTVDAGAALWTFAIPEAAVTHTAHIPTDHTVDVGDVSWTFDLPQPSVTHATPTTTAHTVNASPAAWTFALPEASVTRTAATVPAQPTGLVATVTHDTISLSWDDPGDASITSYQILRRDISGGGSLGVHIDSVPAGTSYVDTTNVASENAYSYRIKARNAQGLSGQSAFRNVTTSAPPVVTTDHTVNAGDAEWTFAAPQASVTHTGPADHAVDAGDASWAFAVPRAGVARVANHAVGAGDVSWSFDLPQAGIAHTTPAPINHVVNAGDASWTFVLPRSSVAHTQVIAPAFADDTGSAQRWTQGTAITAITVPAATGDPAPTYAATGRLPAGVAFDARTRVISGTPTATGSGTIRIRATNAAGVADWTVAYRIADRPVAPAFADDTGVAQRWPQGTAITPITVPVATGVPAPTYTVRGGLPPGIAFNATTRVISGTPTVVRSGTITIRATNGAGVDDWKVAYSIAGSVVQPPSVIVLPVMTLQIDWGNDGTFGHAAADVTSDMVKDSLRTTRGRTLQSRRKAVAGRLECKLWNLNAKYDPINSSSPIYEKDISGLRIRAQLAGVTVWAGRIDTQRYRNRPVPQLDIIALGLLSTLRQPVSVAGQIAKSSGSIAKLVGAAIGIVTTYLTGGKTLDRWQAIADQDALITLRDLEEYEEGFLFERADGDMAMDAKNARSTGDSAVSALTLKDEVATAADIPLLEGSALDWGYRYIANTVRVPVKVLEPAVTIITLWSGSHVKVGAHVIFDILIGYPEDNQAPLSHRGVVTWKEPVPGTDFTAQAGLRITGAVQGDGYLLTFSNSTNSVINVGPLKVRGTPLVVGDTAYIPSRDTDSITAFGEREYARPSPLFTDIGQAQAYADGIVGRQKSPHGWLVARWPAYYAVDKAKTLELSRRITVERLGETRDYYIEAISVALRGFVRMEYLLSPVPGVGVPSAPVVTVTLIRGKPTQLSASWSAPYDGGSPITGYDVQYKKTLDSVWTPWPHTGTGRTTTLTGLERGGISYDVRVRSINNQGSSKWSAAAGATPNQAPGAPAAPLLASLPLARMGVLWRAPYDGGSPITDYDVRYKKTSDSTWIDWPHMGTGTSAALTGLAGAISYDVQVRAQNNQGSSDWSGTGTLLTNANAPARPSAPGVTGGTRRLSVSWSAPDPRGAAITDYDVQYRQGTRGAWKAWGHTGRGRTAAITGLSDGATYYVQVRAQNSAGESEWSSSGAASTAAAATAPSRPSRPTVDADSSSSLEVSWSAPSDGGSRITDYDVQYRQGTRGDWTSWSHVGTNTSTTITGLSADTSYQVQVRAQNNIGESSWSPSSRSERTDDDAPVARVPSRPGAPRVTVLSSSILTAFWDAPDDGGSSITDYEVRYRSVAPAGTSAWETVANLTGTESTLIKGLSAGTFYDVQVRAENNVGDSRWSASGGAFTATS